MFANITLSRSCFAHLTADSLQQLTSEDSRDPERDWVRNKDEIKVSISLLIPYEVVNAFPTQ